MILTEKGECVLVFSNYTIMHKITEIPEVKK